MQNVNAPNDDDIDSDADPNTNVISNVSIAEGTNNFDQDFGLTINRGYTVEKTLNGVDPYRTGDQFSFTIRIENTGSVTITKLPLVDMYVNAFISFVQATPTPDSNANNGMLLWSDLTVSAPNGCGGDLGPGDECLVTVEFIGRLDTSNLGFPDDRTTNTAKVSGGMYDPDGEGPLSEQTLPEEEGSAGVRILSPTGIDLAAYGLTYRNGRVEVSWTTVSESEAISFELERWHPQEGLIAVTSTPIPATRSGQPIGAAYRFEDSAVLAGRTYGYLLTLNLADGSVRHLALGTVTTDNRLFLPEIAKR